MGFGKSGKAMKQFTSTNGKDKVEHPMTVIRSAHGTGFPFPEPTEYFIYNAWQFKTLELEEVRYILPLN